MRVHVDARKCTGHAMCLWASQDLFDLDDDGHAFVRPGHELVIAEHQAAAREAVEGCPEGAVWIE
ncbi:MAG TPA: ferredoxin [Pseudonocardia sp.]|jgi:ferredoxin